MGTSPGHRRARIAAAVAALGALATSPAARADDPTLQATLPSPVTQTPIAAAATSITNDGRLDLAVLADTPGQAAAGRVIAMLGRGNGTFAPGTGTGQNVVLNMRGVAMLARDLSGDGRTDLVISAVQQVASGTTTVPRGRMLVMIGDPRGGYFGPRVQYASATSGEAPLIAITDANADGRLDLFAIDRGSGTINGYVGTGNGNFNAMAATQVGRAVSGLDAGDVNADGRGDLLVSGGSATSVLFANATGPVGFTPSSSQALNLNTAEITGATLLDLNRDGVTDEVVSTRRTPQTVVGTRSGDVWLYRGIGRWALDPSAVAFDMGPAPRITDVQPDLNGDGYQDITALNPGSAGATVLPSTGDGRFSRLLVTSSSVTTSGIASGDFNGDGKPDLAILDATNRVITGLMNQTPFPPPVAGTGPAAGVTQTSATLTGVVLPRLHTTTWHFEYGLSSAYGASTPEVTINAGRFSVPVSTTIPGLFAGAPIHYRLVATNRFGTAAGPDAVLTTTPIVGSIKFAPKWRTGKQKGQLILKGLPPSVSPMPVTVQSLTTGRAFLVTRIGKGRTSANLRLPEAITPGPYNIFVTSTDAAGAQVTQLAQLNLNAPREGYAIAYVSRNDASPPVRTIRRGSNPRLWPHTIYWHYIFRVAPSPKAKFVYQSCTGPLDVSAVRRSYRTPLVISLPGGRALPRGTYTCTLKVGQKRVPVASATVRIR